MKFFHRILKPNPDERNFIKIQADGGGDFTVQKNPLSSEMIKSIKTNSSCCKIPFQFDSNSGWYPRTSMKLKTFQEDAPFDIDTMFSNTLHNQLYCIKGKTYSSSNTL